MRTFTRVVVPLTVACAIALLVGLWLVPMLGLSKPKEDGLQFMVGMVILFAGAVVSMALTKDTAD